MHSMQNKVTIDEVRTRRGTVLVLPDLFLFATIVVVVVVVEKIDTVDRQPS
jgi:hypothetical protein